ncbi:MAG TPA: fimbria/pilus periplasmic chaperone [Vineibacter sp.]|nr:fimbria/pilus periplasmic chaperone [Vineibacter sp.]
MKSLAIALLCSLCWFGSAMASSLEITPILVEFQAANQAQTITITNRSTQPTRVQIRVFAWTQPAGEDRYEPATDIVFSPPFADIAAGERQVVRLVSRQAVPRGREQAYRIFVDELPSGRGAGIEIPLRILVPMFIGVAESHKPMLAWSARLIAPDRLELTARNAGARRLRVSGLHVMSSGAVLSPPMPAATVLSNGEYRWILALRRQGLRSGGTIALRADSSDGPIDANVSVAGP